MTNESKFLILAAVGLTPVALSYGFAPAASMSFLLDIDASSINSSHIFRAIMGLYLGFVIFWLLGASRESLRVPALWSVAVFMLGIAAGRALSVVVDGVPSPLLLLYLLLEIGFGAVALMLVRGLGTSSTAV